MESPTISDVKVIKLYVDEKTTIGEALEMAAQNSINTIPVLHEGKLIGVFSVKEFLIKSHGFYDPADSVIPYSTNNFNVVYTDTDILKVINHNESELVVVDKKDGFIGLVRMIDVQQKLLEVLHERLERLDAIVEASYNSIISINDKGIIDHMNHSAERLLKLNSMYCLGKHIKEVLPESGLFDVLINGLPQVNVRATIRNRELLINRCPIIKDDKIIGAIAVFQDMTDLNGIIKELSKAQSSLELLETIMESTYDGIVVVDKGGYITKLNKTYQEFLGVGDEAIGKHVTEVIDNTRMHIVTKTGIPEIGEAQVIRGHTTIVKRVPIKQDGEIVGAVGVVMFRDIYELDNLMNKTKQLERELEQYKKKLHEDKFSFDDIIGVSPAIEQAKYYASRAAMTTSNVLITGETGTGKELFAKAIHYTGQRADGPYIKVNCAAIPAELLESELFGYEEGAFTGAKRGGKPGKFEMANHGTIFLDEIGDMPVYMQAKLLRAIQEKEIERVGGIKTIKVDVRIIAATNKNLELMVKNGEFREDLYYRLNVININITPLKEKKEDIDVLVKHLLHKISKNMGKHVDKISDEAMTILKSYSWPGNIRELENVLERAIDMVEYGYIVEERHLPPYIIQKVNPRKNFMPNDLKDVLEQTEREVLERYLKMNKGNKYKTAKMLNISRSTLYEKIEKYNIEIN
ncbi:MAG: sigma 54-interacting transcriptional regulator [Thermoanaerobacteraceae bacterium]|nr:sigma 54-interacting transcriptional regulator [Thermoanaerobacteraceae bacterium]